MNGSGDWTLWDNVLKEKEIAFFSFVEYDVTKWVDRG